MFVPFLTWFAAELSSGQWYLPMFLYFCHAGVTTQATLFFTVRTPLTRRIHAMQQTFPHCSGPRPAVHLAGMFSHLLQRPIPLMRVQKKCVTYMRCAMCSRYSSVCMREQSLELKRLQKPPHSPHVEADVCVGPTPSQTKHFASR